MKLELPGSLFNQITYNNRFGLNEMENLLYKIEINEGVESSYSLFSYYKNGIIERCDLLLKMLIPYEKDEEADQMIKILDDQLQKCYELATRLMD